MPRATFSWLSLSPLDGERFGIKSARATLTDLSQVARTIEFCRTNHVVFMVARCAVDALDIVHALEVAGFGLMDTLIYYRFDFARTALPDQSDQLPIRPIQFGNVGEANGVSTVAAEAFRNYRGHYHADPRLPAAKCDEVYVSWATRACTVAGMADAVIVVENQEQIAGFSVLRLNSAEQGELHLFGVMPGQREQGIGRALVLGSLHWFKAREAQRMITSTQVTNFGSQHIWSQLGLVPDHAFYTFHKWFD